MFIAKNISNGPPLKLALEGNFDESVDLKKLLGGPVPELHLHCRKVTQINSIGVKHWISFFKDLRQSGRKVRFFEISPVLVDSRNYLKAFILPDELESVCVPYFCSSCKTVTLTVATPEQVRAQISTMESAPCSNCGKTAELEEVVEEYFSALLQTE